VTINLGKDSGGELEPIEPSPLRRAVERATARPVIRPRQIAVNVAWYTPRVLRLTFYDSLRFVLRELGPIGRGIWRVLAAWARWKAAYGMAEGIAAAEGNPKGKLTDQRERRRTGRMIVSILVFAAMFGGGWWLFANYQPAFWATAVVLVAIFDAVGRHGQERPEYSPPPALPSVLTANVPLGQLEQTILGALEREMFEPGSFGIAHPLTYDPPRLEYRLQLSLRDELKAEHLRAIERAIGAKDYAIRNLATDTSTIRELVIRVGDSLALPVDRPFLPTGSKSVTEGIDMGTSAGDVPFVIPVAGVHSRVIMATGGGKTSWYLRALIDGLSACRDVVIGGIDITNGPEFALWRGVIQYRGLDPDQADEVLDVALAEIDRRAKILTAIAEDDDPDNDTTEWHSGLGPAFVILIDEFAQLAAYNGKGEYADEPNLVAKALQIIRTGRKHWVSLQCLSQRSGKDDFGSTTMATQCAVTVAGPCSSDDAVRMFGVPRRDAGYTPNMLSPGVEGDIRDAGKVMLDSPMHRTPDLYRVYAPGSAAEVKRRARQRMDDGLPSLRDVVQPDALDAVEVPPVLHAVEQVFIARGRPEKITSEELAAEVGQGNGDRLAAALRNEAPDPPRALRPSRRKFRPAPGVNPVHGYYWRDVEKAIREL
jgi:hypothetical protein